MAPVVPIVLLAAALHAGWNALVKAVADRLTLMAMMGVATAAIALPVAVLVSPPRSVAWPEVAGSLLLHTIYNLMLVASYGWGTTTWSTRWRAGRRRRWWRSPR